MTNMGHIYLYYGTGGGKTAAGLGLALRSLGHGHHVVVVQFLKYWKKTGEYKMKTVLATLYEIRQYGKPGWLKIGEEGDKFTDGSFTATLRRADEEDAAFARKGLNYVKKLLKDDPPELLILDEACLAAYIGVVDISELIAILDKIPEKTDVVLTGRYAPQALIDRADFVNEVREIKAPANFVSREGIQF